MSTIGGGLQDRYPSPRADSGPRREALFWAVMVFMVWAAMQGWPESVFMFLGVGLIVASGLWLFNEATDQLRKPR